MANRFERSSDPLRQGRVESSDIAEAWIGRRDQPLVQRIGFFVFSFIFILSGIMFLSGSLDELSSENLILGALGLALITIGGIGLKNSASRLESVASVFNYREARARLRLSRAPGQLPCGEGNRFRWGWGDLDASKIVASNVM